MPSTLSHLSPDRKKVTEIKQGIYQNYSNETGCKFEISSQCAFTHLADEHSDFCSTEWKIHYYIRYNPFLFICSTWRTQTQVALDRDQH